MAVWTGRGRRLGRASTTALAAGIAALTALLVVGPVGAAVRPALLDDPPGVTPATLELATTAPTGVGGATALTASARYRICGVPWATSRNTPNGIVLGSVYGGTSCANQDGDIFDVTDTNSTGSYGGYSYRAHCGFIEIAHVDNMHTGGANVPCASTNMSYYEDQFAALMNYTGCGHYTPIVSWSGVQTSVMACINLSIPPQEITSTTTGVTCRSSSDQLPIFKGDAISWRYSTRDSHFVEIKDERYSEGGGRYMFLPWTGNGNPITIACEPVGNPGAGCEVAPHSFTG